MNKLEALAEKIKDPAMAEAVRTFGEEVSRIEKNSEKKLSDFGLKLDEVSKGMVAFQGGVLEKLSARVAEGKMSRGDAIEMAVSLGARPEDFDEVYHHQQGKINSPE